MAMVVAGILSGYSATDICKTFIESTKSMVSSMLVVGSQYWNSVHGNTPEEVRKDEEGMQVMRTLAENLAWLLGCLQAGADTVEKPVYEPRIATNFIR